MRYWAPYLLFALLGGCLTSETPKIPVEDLARPKSFEGRFWYLSLQHDSGLTAYLVGIGAKDGRIFEQSRGDTTRFRLVRLAGDSVFLFISDAEKGEEKDDNLSTYYLLQRRESGTWEWDDISVNYAGPFAKQNAAYLNRVAGRHGLNLESPEDSTRIEGPVHGLVIPKLFRDPAFLGALRVTPVGAYLPARRGLVPGAAANFASTGRVRFELELAREIVLLRTQLAQPQGFEGQYLQFSAGADTASDARIDARPDGRYDLYMGETVYTLGLLPFESASQTFIGIRDWTFESGGQKEHHSGLVIVARADKGWRLTSIVARPSAGSKMLDAMLERLSRDALQRHGLAMDNGRIGGALDAERLLALLHDGEFTSGLGLDEEPLTLSATPPQASGGHPDGTKRP